MERDGFIFYNSFYEAGKFLDDKNRLDYYDRIMNYGILGVDKKKGEQVEMLFALIKPQLDANNKKFVNGNKGGRPKKKPVVKKENNHRLKKNKPKEKEKEKEKENVKEKEKENNNTQEEKKRVFIERANTHNIQGKDGYVSARTIITLLKLGWIPAKGDSISSFREWVENLLKTYEITSVVEYKKRLDGFYKYWSTQPPGTHKKKPNWKSKLITNLSLIN